MKQRAGKDAGLSSEVEVARQMVQVDGSGSGPPISLDFSREYARCLVEAAGMPREELLVCRASTDVMKANIRTSVAAV